MSKLVRHPGAYKGVIDTVRIALGNVETHLAMELGPLLPKEAEAKKTLANLLTAPGDVTVHRRSVRVVLEPAATGSERAAFAQFLDDINGRKLTLPGDPNRRILRFQVHI